MADSRSRSPVPGSAEFPSLRDICIRVLGQYIVYLEDLGGMDTEHWLRIVKAAGRVDHKVVARVEDANPDLINSETDEAFWKPAVERQFNVRRIIQSPTPLLLQRLVEIKQRLQEWAQHLQAGRQATEPPMVELESMPISIQLLADSGIVPVLKSMRPQSSNASRIVDSWKAHHRALKAAESGTTSESRGKSQATAGSSSGKTMKRKRPEGSGVVAVGSATSGKPETSLWQSLGAQEKEDYMAQSGTWRGLYFVLVELEQRKGERFAERAKKMRHQEAAKKQHVVAVDQFAKKRRPINFSGRSGDRGLPRAAPGPQKPVKRYFGGTPQLGGSASKIQRAPKAGPHVRPSLVLKPSSRGPMSTR